MASRVHAGHHYSFGGVDSRPRREVRLYVDEPVILPRSSNWDVSSVLLVAAAAAVGIVVASAYAVFHQEPPRLRDTPTLALMREPVSDADLMSAHVLKALNGPVFAVPSKETPASVSDDETLAPSLIPENRQDYVVDDAAPGVQPPVPQKQNPQLEAPFPEPTRPRSADPGTYPDPTTTPPDAVAPPNTSPETPTPALDPENPYR